MPRSTPDWLALLKAAHEERTGVGEDVLQHALAGQHTPYRWLARAVAARADLVLDVACGSGAMTRQLGHPGRRVIGVDSRVEELRLAGSRSPGEWVCADARALPFPDATFAAVTSALGLAVIHPTDRFIGEAARVLRPGGVLAMMAPATWPMRAPEFVTVARLAGVLGSRPRLPGVAHRAEIDVALAAHRLRRVETRRELYHVTVSGRDDAERVVHGLYLPPRSRRRLRTGVDVLVARVERDGPLTIPIPLRRIVALK